MEAEIIPAFTRVNKSTVDAQIVSIKGTKEGAKHEAPTHPPYQRSFSVLFGVADDPRFVCPSLISFLPPDSHVHYIGTILAQKLVFAVIDVGARVLDN